MAVSYQIDPQALARLAEPGGLVDQAVRKEAGRIRDNAKRILKQEGQVDTGRLRQSIRYVRQPTANGRVTYHIGSDVRHALWQHDGTRDVILPRRATVLRFKPRGASGYVYAKKVKGVRGTKFLVRAMTPGPTIRV